MLESMAWMRGRVAWLAVAAGLCVALVTVGCGQEEVQREATVTVRRGPLVFASSYYGDLDAKESVAIHAPELPGGQDAMTVETVKTDGDKVEAGDVVLTFVTGPTEDELRTNKADLAVAEAEMRRVEQQLSKERIDLELEVKRRQKALERAKLYVVEGVNLISRLELDKYKLDVERAKLELELADKALRTFAQKRAASLEVQRLKVEAVQQKVREAEDQLAKMQVTSPTSGVIFAPYTRLNWVRGKVEPGRVCRSGDKLLEIPDLSTFVLNLYVRQGDATLITEGASATVYPSASPGAVMSGKVLRKEKFAATRNERLGTENAEGNLKEVLVVVELDETMSELRPGGTARVDLSVTLVEDALLVPLASVVDKGRETWVKLRGGEERKVKLGQTNTVFAEVLDGLAEGDVVVLAEAAPEAEEGKGGGRGGM